MTKENAFDPLDDSPEDLKKARKTRNKQLFLTALCGSAASIASSPALIAGLLIVLEEHRQPKPVFVEPSPELDELSQAYPDPPSILVDSFARDFENSACDSSRSAERAARIYDAVFDLNDMESLSLEELQSESEHAVNALAEARKHLDFVPLPGNIHDMAQEMERGTNDLSLDIYKEALDEMLAHLDIEAVYAWEPSSVSTDNAPGVEEAIPIEPTTPEHVIALKQAIFGTILGYSHLPTNIIKTAGANKIYFGNVIDSVPAAIAVSSVDLTSTYRRIVVDVSDPLGYEFRSSATSHEIAHHYQLAICESSLDKAWIAQNPQGFHYSSESEDTLNTDGYLADTMSTSLATLPPLVGGTDSLSAVVTRPYGVRNQEESFATLVGEYTFDPTSTEQLFKIPSISEPLYRQLAIHIARMQHYMPQEAEYYTRLLLAASLEHESRQRSNVLFNEAKSFRIQHPEYLFAQDRDLPPEILQVQEDAVQYLYLSQILQDSQTNGTASTKILPIVGH